MHAQKRRLGRGLAALIGDDETQPGQAGSDTQDGLRHVPIEHIHPNPRNPRKAFAAEELQELAQSIQSHIRHRMPQWRTQYTGVEDMTVAVMGCVVNGPGESKHANIGISLPGTGERPVAPVYEDGQKTVTLKGEQIAAEFQELVERYVARGYAPLEPDGRRPSASHAANQPPEPTP